MYISGELLYKRDGDTFKPFRGDSDDGLFGCTHYYYVSAWYEVKGIPETKVHSTTGRKNY